ncbi:uncharacterized protein VTP21DRAFT_17 [Calcarisporiella thermophila]|uniref:uncharacterized protein n=1 Tax=Calcarisporiella thermophila TaxID=911321 RepID=UPI00374231AE
MENTSENSKQDDQPQNPTVKDPVSSPPADGDSRPSTPTENPSASTPHSHSPARSHPHTRSNSSSDLATAAAAAALGLETSPVQRLPLPFASQNHDMPSLDAVLDPASNEVLSNTSDENESESKHPNTEADANGESEEKDQRADDIIETPTAPGVAVLLDPKRRSLRVDELRASLESQHRTTPHTAPRTNNAPSSSRPQSNETSTPTVKVSRNYKVSGRNRFLFGGRMVTSREYWAFLLALGAFLIPSGLFFGFVCPWLWHNISPAVPIVFAYLFLLAFASMLRTSFSDPGIIPRNLDPKPPTDPAGLAEEGFAQAYANVPLPKSVRIKDQIVWLKYCETCKIYRPPRCSHCRQCDNCVENEDHHCIWLNNCVGRRNYRSFITFIVTASVMCLYVLGFSLAHLLLLMRDHQLSFIDAIRATPMSLVITLMSFILSWSVCGLTGYHLFLISRNLTTHEQLRASMGGRQLSTKHPFDYGHLWQNCFYVLCRPQTKSYLRKPAYEIDQLDPPGHQGEVDEEAVNANGPHQNQ